MSQQVNLFNPIFLKEKKHFSAKAMGQALLVVLVFVVALFAFAKYQTWQQNKEAARVAAQLKEATRQAATLKGYAARKKNPQLEEEVMQAQRDVTALKQAFARLRNDEVGAKEGYSDYLRAFARQIVQGVWLTGFSIDGAGNAIGLQGAALKPELIPVYMNRLKREEVLQGKTFASFEIRQHKEQKPAESSKPSAAQGKSSTQIPSLPYVEFDLRSEGVETVAATSPVTGAAAPMAGGR